jgi:DNA-binding LacI/PurR family transcriptional regulator
LGDISNPHFGIMVKEIEKEARKQDYNVFVINSEEDHELEEKADMIAWETVYMLEKLGYKFADDFSIIGFDNIQSRMFIPFPLTSVSNSKAKMSQRAFDILLQKINNPDAQQHFREIIEIKLVIRASTRKLEN